MALTRRGFLRTTLSAAAVLGVGGFVVGRWRRAPRPYAIEGALRHLDATEAAILATIAQTFLPPAEGFPTLEEVRLVERIDEKLSHVHPVDRKDFRTLLRLVEYAAPLLGPARGFFSALLPDEREAYLFAFERSRLGFKRTAFGALKYFVMMTYYDTPEAWPGIGYAGPPTIVREGEATP